MHLPLTAAVAPHLEFVDEIGSTNAELSARATSAVEAGKPLPHFSVLLTNSQTAGRGRLGRSWVAPPGATVAVSVLLNPPQGGFTNLGWIPLLAGLAMTRAVGSLLEGPPVTLKWPNDVHIDGLKVSGILGEVLPSGALIMGAGLNLTMTEDQLPVPTATSLGLWAPVGDDITDRAVAAYLTQLRDLLIGFERSGSNPAAGLRASVVAACGTLGRDVRVELPSGESLYGVAVDIDADGRLVVRDERNGRSESVAAGDVTHLRYE